MHCVAETIISRPRARAHAGEGVGRREGVV